jgi:hypothetical protein
VVYKLSCAFRAKYLRRTENTTGLCEAAVGRSADELNTEFATRSLHWTFDSYEQAEAARYRLSTTKTRFLYLSIAHP